MSKKDNAKTSNIISFEQSADFFYKLGVEKRNRDDLLSALNYQRRALEISPSDKINAEIADILSEMEYPHESNMHIISAFPDQKTRPFEVAAMLCDNFIMQGENLQAAIASLKHNKNKTRSQDQERLYSFDALVGAFDLGTFLPRHESIDADVPEYVESRLQWLIIQGEYEAAARVCERFLNAFPAAGDILQMFIFINIMLGDYETASLLFNKFLGNDLKNPGFLSVCSIIMITAHDLNDDLYPMIGDVAEHLPANPFEAYVLVETAFLLGHAEYTEQHIKRLLKLYPYSKNLLHKKAVCLAAKGDFKQAAAQYERILKIFPGNFLAQEFKSRCLSACETPENKPALPVRFMPCAGMRITADDMIKDKSSVKYISLKSLLELLKVYPEIFPEPSECEKRLRDFLLIQSIPYRAKTAALRQLMNMRAKPPYAVALDSAIVEGSPNDLSALSGLHPLFRFEAEQSIKILKRSLHSICAMVAIDLWDYYGACLKYTGYDDIEGFEHKIAAAIAYKAIMRCDPFCTEGSVCEKFDISLPDLIQGIGLLNDIEALGED